jgi:hypothetical protein
MAQLPQHTQTPRRVVVMKNQRGQAMTEAVLILVLMLAIAGSVSAAFRQNELLAKLVRSPWDKISGMIQNGHWSSPSSSNQIHPSHHFRHISIQGEVPR